MCWPTGHILLALEPLSTLPCMPRKSPCQHSHTFQISQHSAGAMLPFPPCTSCTLRTALCTTAYCAFNSLLLVQDDAAAQSQASEAVQGLTWPLIVKHFNGWVHLIGWAQAGQAPVFIINLLHMARAPKAPYAPVIHSIWPAGISIHSTPGCDTFTRIFELLFLKYALVFIVLAMCVQFMWPPFFHVPCGVPSGTRR